MNKKLYIFLWTLGIYVLICLFTSVNVAISQMEKVQYPKLYYAGCDIDGPWTRIFYGKLFCQIEKD